MYVQSNMEPALVSIRMKIEDRLRSLALKKNMDIGVNYSMIDLSEELCNIDALSPTEFRAIRYLMDTYDKVIHACKIDPGLVKEATEIGERVIRIIDHRLEIA
jgi:hypothetical protein